MRSCVILANGERPSSPLACATWMCADEVIACDGAVELAHALGREPDFVVGDGDSLTPNVREKLGVRFIQEMEQETNDLAKAFRFACAHTVEPTRLLILGATGRREDHTLGNIFHLFDFHEQIKKTSFTSLQLVTNEGVFEVVEGCAELASFEGMAVSLFATDGRTHVSSEQLQWPLEGVRFSNLWCATLNRATATHFKLVTNRPVLVFRACHML